MDWALIKLCFRGNDSKADNLKQFMSSIKVAWHLGCNFGPEKGLWATYKQSFGQDIGQISTWEIFIRSLVEKYLFMKNSTDFRKTVETGVDLRLLILSFFFQSTVTDLWGPGANWTETNWTTEKYQRLLWKTRWKQQTRRDYVQRASGSFNR